MSNHQIRYKRQLIKALATLLGLSLVAPTAATSELKAKTRMNDVVADNWADQQDIANMIMNRVNAVPSVEPSYDPTRTPTATPSMMPSVSSIPTATPSVSPSASMEPSKTPSSSPSISSAPSEFPSSVPSSSPTDIPSVSTISIDYIQLTCCS